MGSPAENYCRHFLVRKKRYCRMTVRKGQNFCGEHLPNAECSGSEDQKLKRVACPFDPKHTCYVKQLKKHLKICNARPMELPPYITPGVNLLNNSSEVPEITLGEISDTYLLDLIDRVKLITATSIPTVPEEILSHSALREELMKTEYGPCTRKHLLQNSSLLGHIEKCGLIKDETCFVEFGAGRGQLSYWLSQVGSLEKCLMLLVDRASHRHKYENRMKSISSPTVVRVRADIADLCISRIDVIHQYQRTAVITKHLCGAATDVALQCIVASLSDEVERKVSISGLVMAVCCHHRCTWNTYVGRETFEKLGFSDIDFKLMCSLASWATCGGRKTISYQSKCDTSETFDFSEDHQKSRIGRLNLNQEEREEIGRACKLILDYGRQKFLEKNGFDVKLLFYINQDVSPENMCIVGSRSVTQAA